MKNNTNSKQMLFEMMSKIDKSFKPRLNEDYIMNNPQSPYKLSALKMPEAREVTFIIDAASDEEALIKAKEQYADEVSKGMNLGRAILFKQNAKLSDINEAENTTFKNDIVNDITTLLGNRPTLSPKEIEQMAGDYQVSPDEVQRTMQYVISTNKENQPQIASSSKEAEEINDFFKFLKNNPQMKSAATLEYGSTLDRYMAKPKQNPMMGKFVKVTKYTFQWEDTYRDAVERTNPDWQIQQTKGEYTKVEGFNILRRDKQGKEELPIVPAGAKSLVLILGENGEVVDTLKTGELATKYAEYFQPSFFNPSTPATPGSGVSFRGLKVDSIKRLAAGGKVWENPNFKFAKYSEYFKQIPQPD